MKLTKKLFVILFLVAFATTMVGCDSKPSSSSSSLSRDIYEEEEQKNFPCELCKGYGVYAGYTCNRCDGTGEVVAEYVETRSNSNVSFKGISYYYGRCNGGCGCQIYEHKPGQTACINCAANGCTTNKFGHKKEI